MGALDAVFREFFYNICAIAKWIFAIKMATNIIRNGEQADWQGSIQILIGGGFQYAMLYAIINVLDSVKAGF